MSDATVLIADDSLLIREVVRADLEEEGYLVVEAVDGPSAVEQCRSLPPDVVLLDVEMPGLDGYQVLSELKSDDRLRNIPVVFLTSRGSMDDVLAGLRGGAHDYLRKPFEPAELIARVTSACHVKKLQDQLHQRNQELEHLSRTDMLTGLYNRRHLEEELARRHRDSLRHHDPLCCVVLDIDHFKTINDTHGHAAGDEVLRIFSMRLRDELRTGDIGGRWGGEEFLLILPRTDLSEAVSVAERVRRRTSAEDVAFGGRTIPVTVSGGCAVGPTDTPDALVALADAQLYQAKLAGRDRIGRKEA